MIPLHNDLQEFKTYADWRIDRDDDDSLSFLERALGVLVFDGDFLSRSINTELEAILKRPFDAPASWKSRHVVAISEPNWQLHYGMVSETAEFIRSNTSQAMIAVVGPEPLVVDYYRATQDIDTDVFDASVMLKQPRRKVHRPGTICTIDPREGIADLVVTAPTFVVTLLGPTRRAIQWIFSRQTLRAVQSIPSNPADAEIAILIRALTAMRSTTSVSTLCELTTHESHFVRWTALQALLELSPEAAKSSLQRATEDAHPQVRLASEKAIAAMAA